MGFKISIVLLDTGNYTYNSSFMIFKYTDKLTSFDPTISIIVKDEVNFF